MDCSVEYIEMCRKANEIQNKPVPLCFINYENVYIDYSGNFWSLEKHQQGWLPRQDQLQDVVFDETVGLQSRCYAIYNFSISFEKSGGNSIIIDGSMEQLWLAFVMLEKFNKKWDGTG